MMFNLDELIKDQDISYEETLQKNPDDESIWKNYYINKINDCLNSKIFILSRSIREIPKSEELWILYLNLLIENYQQIKPKDIINAFDNCLTYHQKSIKINLLILQFLTNHIIIDITCIRKKFNQALQNLPIETHDQIWELYLKFANKVKGATASQIYMRFSKFINPKVFNGMEIDSNPNLNFTILDLIEKLKGFNDKTNVKNLYHDLTSSHTDYSNLSKSQVQILYEFLDWLISNKQKDEKYFTTKIKKLIEKFPDQSTNLNLKLIEYYKSTNSNYHKIKSIFENSIIQCKTIQDFKNLYNEYTKSEEFEIENYLSTTKPPDLSYLKMLLNQYETLLNNRSILLNDLKLSIDPNNVDYWFQRFDIYKDDLNNQIKTIAQSIKSINPLKIPNSCTHRLKDIWIKYSDIYSSQSDYKTADFILSKSVQSQFPKVDELADLYIYWCELRLSSNHFQETSSIEILKNLLFSNEDPDINQININDSSIPIQRRIQKSKKIWEFFIDLIDSFLEVNNSTYMNLLNEVIEKMIILKIATPKNLMVYASILQQHYQIEKSLSVYEKALQLFKDKEIQLEIWKIYLTKLNYIDNKERIKDIKERYVYFLK
ncbi:SYF1 [Candida jiufengensis]|uniref:SYF1 n=1 Tax=Candida jiufengensis TaxID=497108 RepID=UPI002224BC92|nr:SYF1 [Candida jiufengensis]KAI5955001.1 SYF1 [Candida jiufengensis]